MTVPGKPPTGELDAGFDPFDPATVDETDEWRALRNALTLAEGFKLLFLLSNSRVRSKELASDLVDAGQPVEIVELLHPIARWESLRSRLPIGRTRCPVLLLGLELSIAGGPIEHSASPLLADLNAARDVLRTQIGAPLIIALDARRLAIVEHQAPDFFSIRSGLFAFDRASERRVPASRLVNLLVMGDPDIGKTALAAALAGSSRRSEPDTPDHGLEIRAACIAQDEQTGVDIEFRVWDFGAQEVEHGLVPAFLPGCDSVVLIALPPGIEQSRPQLRRWLDIVRTHTPESLVLPVVLTRAGLSIALDDSYLSELQAAYPALVELYRVNIHTGEGIVELRAGIAHAAAALPDAHQNWPESWHLATRRLSQFTRHHVATAELSQALTKRGNDPEYPLVRALHTRGDIRCFDPGSVAGARAVLEPAWLSGVLAQLLSAEEAQATRGVLTREQLDSVWDTQQPVIRAWLTDVLDFLGLSVSLPDGGVLLWQQVPSQASFKPAGIAMREPGWERPDRVYHLKTPAPTRLMMQLLARTYRFATGNHWRHGAVLSDGGHHTAWIESLTDPPRIELTMNGPQPANFMQLLRDELEPLLEQWPELALDRRIGEPSQAQPKISAARGALWWVPELPPHYIPRPAETQGVIAALCRDSEATVGLTASASEGLLGMGGIGKSVLAAAVARSDAIRKRFTDGIYWLTVGQDPQVAALLAQVGRALGIDDAFYGLADGKQKLAAALAGKRVLLVLDDVWDAAHVAALDVVSSIGEEVPTGRTLITTRSLDVLTWSGVEVHPLDIMTTEQARVLLAEWSGIALAEVPAEANDVAEACGRLPLALVLAGALVRRPGGSWARVLRLLQTAKLDKLHGQIPEYPYRNVYQAMAASTGQLAADGIFEHAEQCYADLAVFAEDEAIPASALRVLWSRHGLDADDADELASTLASYSLAILNSDQSLRLHDIQRAYARACTEDIAVLQEAFVDAYTAMCPDADLTRGPADKDTQDYFYARLPYHLIEADRDGDLHRLLSSYAWLDGKLRAHGIVEVLADFDRLKELDAHERVLTLVRDALRLSSHVLATDAAQLPGQLIGRLRGFDDESGVRVLLDRANVEPTQPWIYPYVANLTAPGGTLVRTLLGHSSAVRALALSDDGTRALSGSDNAVLKFWDIESGALLRTFSGHSGGVTAVALSGDARRAISGSSDQTLKLWDTSTGDLLRTFEGHSSGVNTVALSTDGRRALSGSLDRTLKLWDVEHGTLLRTFEGHSDSVNSVILDERGQRVLSGSSDRTLKLWNIQTGAVLRTFEGNAYPVAAVALSSDGKRALSGHSRGVIVAHTQAGKQLLAGADHTLKLWDIETGELVRTFEGHLSSAHAVALSNDGQRALASTENAALKLWDTKNGSLLGTFEGHSAQVSKLQLSVDGERALSGSDDQTLKLWNMEAASRLRTAESAKLPITSVAMSADGKQAFSGSYGREFLGAWDTQSGAFKRDIEVDHPDVHAVGLTRDGSRVFARSQGETVLFDTRSRERLCTLKVRVSSYYTIALSEDGKRAVSGHPRAGRLREDGTLDLTSSRSNTLKLWDTEQGTLVHTFQGHSAPIMAVALSMDGKRALSAEYDGPLRVWDAERGVILHSLGDRTLVPVAVSLSDDGQRALASCDDGTLKLWDTDSGALIQTFEGHTNWVQTVALSADGKRALSGSRDQTLKLWDIATGRVIATFSADTSIDTCALSANGCTFIAGDRYGRVYLMALSDPRVEPVLVRQLRPQVSDLRARVLTAERPPLDTPAAIDSMFDDLGCIVDAVADELAGNAPEVNGLPAVSRRAIRALAPEAIRDAELLRQGSHLLAREPANAPELQAILEAIKVAL